MVRARACISPRATAPALAGRAASSDRATAVRAEANRLLAHADVLEADPLAAELFHQLTLAAPEQRAVVWELAVCRQRRAPKEPTTATGPAEMAFGERRSSRARREATSFAVARRSRRMRRCAPSPATCWSLATLSNVGAVCARRAWGVGRARGHVSLCRLVIMFVITTGPVGPVRPHGPKRPAATARSGAKSGPTAMLTRSRAVETKVNKIAAMRAS